ncbi:DUF3027 domain-containing protein [Bradyrhizobium jicamae]|uniref:DUF3027 domain-containing protein n=1 Tax=Bradyrhizobium jicamae TaxID=280332 RepID=UPI001BA9AD95|nr:DUF3027 domain-containing protein [Bradyrhizobium jicamae]
MKHKALSSEHFLNCHVRWEKFRNRDLTRGEQTSKWNETQCESCAYYVPLVGKFSEDYGACTNGISPFDGRIMFEHDGCGEHSLSDHFLQFSISYKNGDP